jgi:hypothetical protein
VKLRFPDYKAGLLALHDEILAKINGGGTHAL